jgi:hypothetical protein
MLDPRVKAVAVYLIICQHIPLERAHELRPHLPPTRVGIVSRSRIHRRNTGSRHGDSGANVDPKAFK